MSCGPSAGVNDFIDAQYVGLSPARSITNVCSAVLVVPHSLHLYIRSRSPLRSAIRRLRPTVPAATSRTASTSTTVRAARSSSPASRTTPTWGSPLHPSQPYKVMPLPPPSAHHGSLTGDFRNTTCPPGYDRLDQDLNEGTTQHQYFIYLCVSYQVDACHRLNAAHCLIRELQNYQFGVNDVENILVYSSPNAPTQSAPPGFTDCGQDLNSGTAGSSIAWLWKQGNGSVTMPNPVIFPNLVYMRCNYTYAHTGASFALFIHIFADSHM